MNIRPFQSGDETAQVEIYNAVAAGMPYFKPASAQEIVRRTRSRDFDPNSRFFAEDGGRLVGYCSFHGNGRVSYPWCLPGHEACAGPLFDKVLEGMRGKKLRRAFAAYRPDWDKVHAFFLKQGFCRAREVMNFLIDLVDMPTPSARLAHSVTPLRRDDLPAILPLYPQALRPENEQEVERHLLRNAYFGTDSVFALRSRADQAPVGVGVVIAEPTFANPRAVDPNMPCFRLGAFGSERMQVKRVNGMFSFLARSDANVYSVGMDLMGYAAYRLRENDELDCLAAQVVSDAPSLMSFYQRNFRLHGKFPIFEKDLS